MEREEHKRKEECNCFAFFKQFEFQKTARLLQKLTESKACVISVAAQRITNSRGASDSS
jgi:hypothetical protein